MEINAADDDVGQETPLKFYTFPVTTQPADASVAIGADAVFTGAFSIPMGTAVTYKWQIKMVLSLRTAEGVIQTLQAGGAIAVGDGQGHTSSLDIWNDLTEMAGVYQGVDTDTLTVKGIDSFLAQNGGAQFRLKVVRDLVPTIPSFTVGARVLVDTFFSWVAGPNAIYNGQISPDAFQVLLGFTDPDPGLWTLTWEFVSGSGDISWISGDNFSFTGAAESGLTLAVWRKKATQGLATVYSDPQTIVYYAAVVGSITTEFLFPYYPTQSGAPMNLTRSLDGVLEIFQAFLPVVQVNTRWTGAPAITIADLTLPSGIFTGLTATAQPAGTFVSAIFGLTGTDGVSPFFYFGVPNDGLFVPMGAAYGIGTYFYLGLVNPFA